MSMPDYHKSIINLAASIYMARGRDQLGYEPLAELTDLGLADRTIVLLIVDGLGDNFLKEYPGSFLRSRRRGRLSSVFPPTTATAITSYFTGTAPQQHGIAGWYTYFRELGAVATVLPFIPRYGGADFSQAGISPRQLIDGESQLAVLSGPSHVVLPQQLVDSVYSRALSGSAVRHGYRDLGEMFNIFEGLSVQPGRGLIIGYWSDLDSLAHNVGISSPEVAELFQKLDQCCRRSLPRLAASGAAVLVSADHGLIDVPEDRVVNLEEHPLLAETLTLPLCGEPRCAYCYVRSDSRANFERYVVEELPHACELKKSSELINEGYFGMGSCSPRLTERVGEYALLMKENYIIKDRLPSEKDSQFIGVHGGISADELHVPLIVV